MAPVCVVIELNLPPTLCVRQKRKGWGTRLTPEQQAVFVGEMPEVFVPIAGGWGRMGMTHIRLAAASEDVLAGALRTAWKLRVEKNAKAGKRRSAKKWRVASDEKRKTKKKKR